ncbi:RagB/SusD family nutrient uptake outer membrane protein [uncultured Acetobacteroides sp.]|uniref:RagB/SusD family nutrient uptake outer membrane protein n=1 Tax=uncultured Acetobacteroides sp. TaxID=1760811 RepID=UPI0029F59A7D|nr:RagB/SusD family nutrient uptake outer membrane protein [uncultured Acetobacteroides sp.]
MKIVNKLFMLMSIVGLAACSDLDYDEHVSADKNDVFTSFDKTRGFVTDIYGQLGGFVTFDNGMLASATDEAVFSKPSSRVHDFYNGSWSAIRTMTNWSNYYKAIRSVNTFLIESKGQTFSQFANNKDYKEQMDRFNNYQWEVRFLRAYFYFELVKTYGDVPFVGDKVLSAEEANTITRTPAKEIFDYINKECTEIIPNLPPTYVGSVYKEIGRVTRAAAMALKARAALYAASPLFNKDNNKELWKAAALASKELLDFASSNGIKLGAYEKNWGVDNYKNAEVIFARGTGDSNWMEYANFPVGVEGGGGGNCPSQTLVDAYQMKTTGKYWDEAGSGYDPASPWVGRDPRFYLTVAKNGDTKWPTYNTKPLETFEGGVNGAPLAGATPTGYYLKKWIEVSVDLRPGKETSKRHSWVIFRLGEFYLNYAEAVYRYLGSPDATSAEFPMSAIAAVNVIRSRTGVAMPALPAGMDNATFEKSYMNERFVELAFEDHRFYDVRRWKKGPEFFTKVGVLHLKKDAQGSLVYERGYQSRIWEDKMYFAPIPYAEIVINPNLKQNTGW